MLDIPWSPDVPMVFRRIATDVYLRDLGGLPRELPPMIITESEERELIEWQRRGDAESHAFASQLRLFRGLPVEEYRGAWPNGLDGELCLGIRIHVRKDVPVPDPNDPAPPPSVEDATPSEGDAAVLVARLRALRDAKAAERACARAVAETHEDRVAVLLYRMSMALDRAVEIIDRASTVLLSPVARPRPASHPPEVLGSGTSPLWRIVARDRNSGARVGYYESDRLPEVGDSMGEVGTGTLIAFAVRADSSRRRATVIVGVQEPVAPPAPVAAAEPAESAESTTEGAPA